MNLTQSDARKIFDYDKDTGTLRWRHDRINSMNSRCVKAGDIAGSMSGCGYKYVKLNGKSFRVHRLIWLYVYGDWPRHLVDHINGVRDDNRLCNLREATYLQNAFNQKRAKNNNSGFKGVRFYKPCSKWMARIRVKRRLIYLGLFETAEEANAAYLAAARQHFKNFFMEEANEQR